jgi:hypothetical protein
MFLQFSALLPSIPSLVPKESQDLEKNATNCHVTILPLQIRHSAGFMGSHLLLQASHEAPQVLLRQWGTLLVSHLRRSWLTGRDFGG